ncbi:MAG: phosphate ABC transporter substrate-binding protein [Variovorax sp.]
MAADFHQLHPGVTFEVKASGSGAGMKDLMEGRSDIGMVARTLTVDEHDWMPFLIGRDGIAVSIHSTNPVSALTDQQVSAIYRKKLTNWRELGGADAPIYVIGTTAAAGAHETFLRQFALKAELVRPDAAVDLLNERYATLLKHPNAIMYGPLGRAEERAAAGDQIKSLPHAGIPATSANLASGRYAIARPLALVTKGLPAGPAKAFIDYVRSPTQFAVLRRFHFVPYND